MNNVQINPYNIPKLQHLITFGAPRVGDQNFSNTVNSIIKGINVRITLNVDPVPQVPDRIGSLYIHAGTEIHFLHAAMQQQMLNNSNNQNQGNILNNESTNESNSLMSRYKNINYFIKNLNVDESGSYLHDNFTGVHAKSKIRTNLKNVFNGGLKDLTNDVKDRIKFGIIDHSSYNLIDSNLLVKALDEFGARLPKIFKRK